jgi:hypothetical protein
MTTPDLSPEEFRRRSRFERAEHERLHHEEKAFRNGIFAELRAGRFDETERTLLSHLHGTGVTRFDVARDAQVTTPRTAVAEWIETSIEMSRRRPPFLAKFMSKELPLSAVEIGLDNAPLAFQRNPAPANPVIKVTGYTDRKFPFSSASDTEIAAVCGWPTPWMGHMDWDFEHNVLEGLGDLNAAVLNFRYSEQPGKFVWIEDEVQVQPEWKAAFVAALLLGLKFQRFIHDTIRVTPVPFPLVVLGCGIDDLDIATMHCRPPISR